jgi:SAM-dependent methyltransferase
LDNENKVDFVKGNVFHLSGVFDIVLCFGGLYHLDNPECLLRFLRDKTKKALIIQTVVTLETEAPEYFVSPCPGWTYGSRFTHAWLVAALRRTGWEIAHEYRNELTYNERACDRGSSYLYCIPSDHTLL